MTYEQQHAVLIEDLKGKLIRQDWHGVSDAANDLRVLEAQRVREPRFTHNPASPLRSRDDYT